MQHQDKYTLTWHSYSDHLREAFKDMMTSSEFADITLVTDDKQRIRAHRNILSACSPVFKNILQLDSNNTNQVIYLRGIQHSEMESIMQYIYLGEARFCEERMSELLMVTKSLEIKELSTGIEMSNQITSNEHETWVADKEDNCDENTTSPLNEGSANVDPKAQAQIPPINAKTSANRKVRRTKVDSKFKCQYCDSIFNTYNGVWKHTKSAHEGINYACNMCDRQFTQQGHLKDHFESKHEGVKYACNQCDYRFAYQSNLTKHIQSIHEGVKYACNQCGKQYTQRVDVTRHIKYKHEG